MVKIPPKLPVIVCFVLSAGRRESISRLEEIAAGADDDSARNASGPKWWRLRPVRGKNLILQNSDVSPSKLNLFLSTQNASASVQSLHKDVNSPAVRPYSIF